MDGKAKFSRDVDDEEVAGDRPMKRRPWSKGTSSARNDGDAPPSKERPRNNGEKKGRRHDDSDDSSPRKLRKEGEGEAQRYPKTARDRKEEDRPSSDNATTSKEYDPFAVHSASEDEGNPNKSKPRNQSPETQKRSKPDASPDKARVHRGYTARSPETERDSKSARGSVFSRLGKEATGTPEKRPSSGRGERGNDRLGKLKHEGEEDSRADRESSRDVDRRRRDRDSRSQGGSEEASWRDRFKKDQSGRGNREVDRDVDKRERRGVRPGPRDEAREENERGRERRGREEGNDRWRDSFKGAEREDRDRPRGSKTKPEHEREDIDNTRNSRRSGLDRSDRWEPDRRDDERDRERRVRSSRDEERQGDDKKPRRSGFDEREERNREVDRERTRRKGFDQVDEISHAANQKPDSLELDKRSSERKPRKTGFDVEPPEGLKSQSQEAKARPDRSPDFRRSTESRRERKGVRDDERGRYGRGREDTIDEERRRRGGDKYRDSDRDSPERGSPLRTRRRGRGDSEEEGEGRIGSRARRDKEGKDLHLSGGEGVEKVDDENLKNLKAAAEAEDAKAKVAKALAAAAAIAAQVAPATAQLAGSPTAGVPLAAQAALAQAAALHVQNKLVAAGLSGVVLPGQLSSPGPAASVQLPSTDTSAPAAGAGVLSPNAAAPAVPMTVEMAAALAAKKAAELINKSMGLSGTMSADEKKKLLWGKKSTPATDEGAAAATAAVVSTASEGGEVSGKVAPGGTNHWELARFGDEATKSKFVKLMGVKGSGAAEGPSAAAVVAGHGAVIDEKSQQVVQEDLEKLYVAGLRRKDGRTVGLGL